VMRARARGTRHRVPIRFRQACAFPTSTVPRIIRSHRFAPPHPLSRPSFRVVEDDADGVAIAGP
jgi:hypothetical protein